MCDLVGCWIMSRSALLRLLGSERYANERIVVSRVCRFMTGTFPGVGISPSFCM